MYQTQKFKATPRNCVCGSQRIFCASSAVSKPGNIAQPLPAQAGLRMRHTPCGYIQDSSGLETLIRHKIFCCASLPNCAVLPWVCYRWKFTGDCKFLKATLHHGGDPFGKHSRSGKAFSRERSRRRGGKRRIYKTGKPFGTAQKMKFANLVSNYNRCG
mgnify:CR=1 FL=1